MNKILSLLSTDAQKKLIKTSMPKFIDPMLATLTNKYFDSPDWMYEHKWDGFRILAFKNNGKITLMTRNGKDYSDHFAQIARGIKAQKSDNFIVDGEVVAYEKGVSKFQYLQDIANLKNNPNVSVVYYVFDIIYFDEYDVTHLKLIDRKKILENTIKDSDTIKLTEYKINKGLEYFKYACEHKWEGVIAKDINAPYVHVRSNSWLKFKCRNEQELIIIGYTNPGGTRIGFGALLLGYYQDGKLQYAGKVGTGFNDYLLEQLSGILKQIEQKNPTVPGTDEKDVHWVKPLIVAEIKFEEWTKDNKLRHPSFLGLRPDKDPALVVKEVPK